MKLFGLGPIFNIHVSVSDLYNLTLGPLTQYSKKGETIVGVYKSLTDTGMQKLGIDEAEKFHFWEYLIRIFGVVRPRWPFSPLPIQCSA